MNPFKAFLGGHFFPLRVLLGYIDTFMKEKIEANSFHVYIKPPPLLPLLTFKSLQPKTKRVLTKKIRKRKRKGCFIHTPSIVEYILHTDYTSYLLLRL